MLRWIKRSGWTRDGNEEGFAHHVLAGDQLLGAASFFVEYDCGKPLQRLTRLVDRAAVGVDAGKFFDEADVTAVGLEIHRGERESACFHLAQIGRAHV